MFRIGDHKANKVQQQIPRRLGFCPLYWQLVEFREMGHPSSFKKVGTDTLEKHNSLFMVVGQKNINEMLFTIGTYIYTD